MASLLGWWRAVLRFIEWRGASASHQWIEPANDITRAILAGTVPELPALKPSEAFSYVDFAESLGLEVRLESEADATRPVGGETLPTAGETPREPGEAPAPKHRGPRAA